MSGEFANGVGLSVIHHRVDCDATLTMISIHIHHWVDSKGKRRPKDISNPKGKWRPMGN